MIIAIDNEATLEIHDDWILIHNNKEGLPLSEYIELSVKFNREQATQLRDYLTKWIDDSHNPMCEVVKTVSINCIRCGKLQADKICDECYDETFNSVGKQEMTDEEYQELMQIGITDAMLGVKQIMYAIAIKSTNLSSWSMQEIVYDDRERCDMVIEGIKIVLKPYAIKRIFFDITESL